MHEHQEFYDSVAWKKCRTSYLKSKKGLCENCLARGIYRPARIVHHKIHLTDETIGDPNVSLCFGNLEALCQDCHAQRHRSERRIVVDSDGDVVGTNS